MWRVSLKKSELKKIDKLPKNVAPVLYRLVEDLKQKGPVQPSWRNYSSLGDNKHHCHLNYHYVACWRTDKATITIEVYYVGSREKAPY